MKTFRKIMAIIFVAFSVIVIHPMIISLAYIIIKISDFGTKKMTIIGGEDLLIINLYITPIVLFVLQIILILVFSVLNLSFAFNNNESRKMRLSLLFLICVIAILHMLFPPYNYIVTYSVLRSTIEKGYSLFGYLYICTLYSVFILTGMSLILYKKKNRAIEEKSRM